MSAQALTRLCFVLVVLATPLLVPLSAGGQPAAAPHEPEGFDRDGYADLAIGVRGESVGSVARAGAVNVLYGDAGSLSTAGAQFWHQDVPGVGEQVEADDELGVSVAAGDLNGDGYGDLAIGVHLEDIETVVNAGAVNVLYGTAAGLTAGTGQFWHQGWETVEGSAEARDGFGRALATGDFDGDGYDDLAVGVPWEDLGALVDTGSVHVFYGSPSGLTDARDRVWDQSDPEVVGDAEANDEFGWAVTAGDFDGDGYDDLAIGAHRQDIDVLADAGRVIVIYGSAGGLLGTTSEVWDLNNPQIGGPAANDRFGAALSAGDFDGDGYDDLVVGIPYHDVSSQGNAGAALVLYGTAGGLSTQDHQLWSQSVAAQEAVEPEDLFGSALAAGDLDGDGYDDLVVAAPGEDIPLGAGVELDAGAVNVLYGTTGGLSGVDNQLWHQGVVELYESPEDYDTFGSALAIADLNGDGYEDLAVGVPGEGYPFDATERSHAGAVQVIYGSGSGLTFTGNQLLRQSDAGIEDDPETDDLFGFSLAAIGHITPGPHRYPVFVPLVLRGW